MPGTVVSNLHICTHSVLPTTLWGRHCHYPQYTEEETEAQRGEATCPRPHSWWVVGWDLKPSSLAVEPLFLASRDAPKYLERKEGDRLSFFLRGW